MSAEAVRDRVEQYRPVFLLDDELLATNPIDDRERVEPVDALGMHLIRREAGAEARENFKAHRLAYGLATHAVEVVDEVDDQREPAAMRLGPQLLELIHRR